MTEDWTRHALPTATNRANAIRRRTSSRSTAAFESDVQKAGLVACGRITEERVVHAGGGSDASALFNGTTKNGSGGDETADDGKTFRGYGAGSVLTIQLTAPHDLTEIRTFAGHPDGRASQGYTVSVARAAEPKKFVELTMAVLECVGGASELRAPVKAKAVVAVRFEFQDGPLGFNVYREINLVGQPTRSR